LNPDLLSHNHNTVW